MGDESEWKNLPAEEKVQHSEWRARVAGYEELIKLFQTLTDKESPEFSKYVGLIKEFVTDSNVVAQEKGLEVTVKFVENYLNSGSAAGEVCSCVVAKCLNQKPEIKRLGMDVLLAFIEAEEQDVVQEELLKGLTNKQPKVVAACVETLREALRDFGTKIVAIKPIEEQLNNLLEHRDNTVRDETKLLVGEIHRWIGAAPLLASLKPVQVAELEPQHLNPQPTRFLRSKQDLKAQMSERAPNATETAGDGADQGPPAAEQILNILSKLPDDFYAKIEEEEEEKRKEALEAVEMLVVKSPKLEQGDYNALVRALTKVVTKDTNVVLVVLAAKCIALLATGLREKFCPHVAECFVALEDKIKELEGLEDDGVESIGQTPDALRESRDTITKESFHPGESFAPNIFHIAEMHRRWILLNDPEKKKKEEEMNKDGLRGLKIEELDLENLNDARERLLEVLESDGLIMEIAWIKEVVNLSLSSTNPATRELGKEIFQQIHELLDWKRVNVSEKMASNDLLMKPFQRKSSLNKALENFQKAIEEAKFITPNIEYVIKVMRYRLNDSNKIIVPTAISLCNQLATSLGPYMRDYIGYIAPGLISNFGDDDPNVRKAAVGTMNTIMDQLGRTGMATLVEKDMLFNALTVEKVTHRVELLGWLSEKLPGSKKLPSKFQECVPILYECFEDENADVRKKANEAVLPFMIHCGSDAMHFALSRYFHRSSEHDAILEALRVAEEVLGIVGLPN